MTTVAHFGSRPLGRKCLQRMHDAERIDVEMVVTYPKDHDGWWHGSLREYARELGYPVTSDPEDVFDIDVDYILSTLYYDILDKPVLEHANLDSLNLHLAELPRYRGSNVFTHAILNARSDGYWKYGVTIHNMTEEIDAGAIVSRSFVDITEDDTARSLYDKAEKEAVSLFEETVPEIECKTIHKNKTPQENYDGKRYFYSRDSIESLSPLSSDEAAEYLSDQEGQIKFYDLTRALHFPPHDPLSIELGEGNIFVSFEDFHRLSNTLQKQVG